MRIIALTRIAKKFSPEKNYTEKEVNAVVKDSICFTDVELIRRELFQYKLLNRRRDGSAYWLEEDWREVYKDYIEENVGKEEKMKIQSIDIVGLGALGVMYADFFTKKLGKERVRVLADRERVERYQAETVTFNGQVCDFNYCDAKMESRPAALLLFAVKYGALDAAMEEVAHLVGENTVLISALNGIRSEEDLGRKFGKEKVVHCIAQKMAAMKEGNAAVCTARGELALGILDGEKEENLKAVTDFFDETGFAYSCPEDMKHAMWGKLLCNVGVNQTLALCGGTYRTVQQEGKEREMMKAAMRETILTANAEGVDLSEQDLEEWVAVIDTLDPDGEPSMKQDIKAGRHTEVALFAGTVCELGKKHGIATPVNDVFLAHFS